MNPFSPLTVVLGVVVGWVVVGAAGLLRPRDVRYAGRALFAVGAAGALALLAAAIWSLGQPAQDWVLPLGLPDLPLHVRLDPLAAFFLALIGSSTVGMSIYSAVYFGA